MEIVKLDSGEVLEKAVNVLRSGGVIVHHTDTCYGFACDVANESAVEKLYSLKNMPRTKPTSMLVNSVEMALEYGDFSGKGIELVEKYWPGALTVIVPRTSNLPDFFNLGIDNVGMRWPNHQFCVELVKGVGGPIATTSANISGQDEVYRIEDLLMQVGEGSVIDLIVDAGEQVKNRPSTIVGVEGEQMKVIRQGDLFLEESIN